MQLPHDYRYILHVERADEDSLRNFRDAFEVTNLRDYMAQVPEDHTFFSSDAVEGNGGLEEAYIMQDLNDLALQFPQLTLHFTGQDLIDRSYGFELKFEDGMVQRAEQLLRRSDFTPPVPYDYFMQIHHQARARAEQQYAKAKLFALCEERESDDGIREFQILAQSADKEGLQKLLQAKIEKDEYGYIASNGIEDHSSDYFRSNFESGFVSYYITEEKILTRADIEALLLTEAYDPTFRGPENLWEIVLEATNAYALKNGYEGLLAEPVINALKQDKAFHAYLIQEGWTSGKQISDGSKLHTINDIHYYFDDLLDERPDYFVETGGLSPVPIPDNLRVLLIDSVYHVARDYQLPVTDAASIADKVLLDPNFQSLCRETYTNIAHLKEDTALYQSAITSCYNSMKEFMLSHLPEKKHPSFQDQVKRAAEIKESQRSLPPVQNLPEPSKSCKDTLPTF